MSKNPKKFSVSISYPPLFKNSQKPFLSQNRQFQWTHTGNVIYPVIPAYAASLLSKNNYQVFWDDAIAQNLSYQDWLNRLIKQKPDLIAIETKTPVIKKHWQIIKQIKNHLPNTTITLMGDHPTAFPKESLNKSVVDYVLTGGDYDFMLLNLANHLTKNTKLEPGFWYRKNNKITNSGPFALKHHNLDDLPIIDRKLTNWKLYAYNNSNYKYTPGSYIMSGRDCWWGKCTFCVTGETKIFTQKGLLSVKNIVDKQENLKVLTHTGKYQKIIDWHKRKTNEDVVIITPLYFPFKLRLTNKHKLFCLPKSNTKHCSQKNGWSYVCKPDQKSHFLKCHHCSKNHYNDYSIEEMEADKLRVGDYIVFPINRKTSNVNFLNIKHVLEKNPTSFTTYKKISDKLIKQIIDLNQKNISQRTISKQLSLDRETVNRYITLAGNNTLNKSINQYSFCSDKISFKGGKNKVFSKIPLNNKFLFLVGLYLAEGCTSYIKNRPNSATTTWTFSTKETTLIKKTKSIFYELFGTNLNQASNQKNNTQQIYIGSTIIAKFFLSLFGHNCYHKKVPSYFLHLPVSKQRSLLNGLFQGDGHLRKRSNKKTGAEYILETTSKQLAEQAFLMLLRFNAIPSFKVKEPRQPNNSRQYKITLSHQDIAKVFPKIKLNDDKNTYKRGFVLGNYALVPIVKLENDKYDGYVYNLSVKNDHSYVANFLSVRNCSWTTLFPGSQFRSFSPQFAVKEIANLVNNFAVKEIFDDSGTLPIGDWLANFASLMDKTGLNKKVRLGANMRFSGPLEADFKNMHKANIQFLLYGLESANQNTLDKINKNLKLNQIETTLKLAKKYHIDNHLTAMIGYPWETKKDAQNTINLAKYFFKKGIADSIQATIIMPYPGTPLFSQAKKNNWLTTTDWNKYDMSQTILKSSINSIDQKELVKSIYKGIITPKFILNKITSIKSMNDIKFLAKYAFKYFQKLKDF